MQRKREHAIELLDQGLNQTEVARRLEVDPRSVRRWVRAHRGAGERGLRAVLASGRPPKLTKRQRQQLEKQLLRGAQSAGFPTELWTCPRVAEFIERTFGVHYHVGHVARLLHSLHWTPQKPTRKAVERDEEAIGEWVNRQWPAIKKKRAS